MNEKRKMMKTPEESLNTLQIRCEREEMRLKALTTSHNITGGERDVLTYIVHCIALERCGKGPRKRIVQSQDVRPFMEYASRLFDRLCRWLHISLRYAWFCQWLCTRYIFLRQRGKASGEALSPHTILSYFKRERAGG